MKNKKVVYSSKKLVTSEKSLDDTFDEAWEEKFGKYDNGGYLEGDAFTKFMNEVIEFDPYSR